MRVQSSHDPRGSLAGEERHSEWTFEELTRDGVRHISVWFIKISVDEERSHRVFGGRPRAVPSLQIHRNSENASEIDVMSDEDFQKAPRMPAGTIDRTRRPLLELGRAAGTSAQRGEATLL